MAAIIFDSKPLVAHMTAELQSEAAQFRKQNHRSARLAQIIADMMVLRRFIADNW